MKIIKYKRPLSDCVLTYIRIVAYAAVSAILLPIIYYAVTRGGKVSVTDRIKDALYQLDRMMHTR